MTENHSHQTIWEVFKRVAEKHGDKTAVIYLGTRFSYRRLKTMAEQFTSALSDMGIRPGHKVVMYIPNSIQWVVVWLGCQKAGVVCVPITPIYTPYDLEYIANDSGADAIVCSDTNFGYVLKVMPATRLKRVIITKMADLLPWWKRYFGYLFNVVPKGRAVYGDNTLPFRRLLAQSSITAQPVTHPAAGIERDSNTAEILYTGGTTKYPKGVPLSHHLFLVSADEQIRISEPLFPVEENIVFCNAPLFHILGQTTGLATLLVGGTLMIQPRVNLDAVFEAIQQFKARTMIGVPTLYRMILEHDRLDYYDLSSVDYWFSAGDVLPIEVGKRWVEKFGRMIHQGYGATETCGGVAMCPLDEEHPPGSVGHIVSSKTVMIVDPVFLEPVKTGEPGELIVSSDPMVSEYLNKPEETARSFVNIQGKTWYRTADIMAMDAEGYLYFVDRAVDIIKHKGYRVSASEIEAVLQENAAVIASCVVGIPDERTGERIKAYVVLKEDIKGITGYELIRWCRDRLAPYKVPHYIEFRDMLPKSKVGKLLRREIRDEEARRMNV